MRYLLLLIILFTKNWIFCGSQNVIFIKTRAQTRNSLTPMLLKKKNQDVVHTVPAAETPSSLRFSASARWPACCSLWLGWPERGGSALRSSGPPLKCLHQACTHPGGRGEIRRAQFILRTDITSGFLPAEGDTRTHNWVNILVFFLKPYLHTVCVCTEGDVWRQSAHFFSSSIFTADSRSAGWPGWAEISCWSTLTIPD